MSERFRYITLATSLPHLGSLFSQAKVPLSEFRLKQRVKMLSPEHQRLLNRVIEVTAWSGVARFANDQDVIRLARVVIDDLKDNPTLQDLVRARMETRTAIAALRLRHDGQEDAGTISEWGFGRWCRQIETHWTDPGFGLSHFMPWISEANRLIQAGEHIAMERLVLGEVFSQLDHHGAGHDFDFEAIVIYVLRWVIVERWSRYSTDAARERLETLVGDILTPPTAADTARENPRPEEVLS
ncbi:hypothetical protein [Roseibium polysiphoniae]|uniref:DUF2764 family protein n=1 Tax=Roseibium polysiphoniae TaxID=2571221 RepID=A0ABR9CFV2_9HYPH|nr:hypothetical protein [Roseibium polysiphoniae]MBD8878748.1 hypothetical protein [Roseibium polysiphoniae]